jgi:hypothetical protein
VGCCISRLFKFNQRSQFSGDVAHFRGSLQTLNTHSGINFIDIIDVCPGIRIETTFLFFYVMYNMYEQSLCSCALILFIFTFLFLVILDLCIFYAVEKINNNISHSN